MLARGASSASPVEAKKDIPPLSEGELRTLYNRGVSRIGIVGLLLDQERRMLLMEHASSAKTRAGMWGALGETALVAKQDNSWRIEAPLDTLARGIHEETTVQPTPNQLWVPRRTPVFFMDWPVGVGRTDIAYAVCPVVVLSQDLVDAIDNAPPVDEISARVFMPIEQAMETRQLRPGMDQWLALASVAAQGTSDLLPVELGQHPLQGPTQDAILEDMYGPRNE